MNIKKNGKRLLSLALALVLCMTAMVCPAMAATDNTVRVRVNGELVEFPDQQPVIDSNSRTLIPVRFVAEELGADVSWEQSSATAIIQKNGLTIRVPIGSNQLTVIDANGKKTTVTMDTEAVNMSGRTMVPIRFVAEAMGAWVDYSNTYRTVGIFDDVLTAAQISKLQAYAHTSPQADITYERGKAKYSESDLLFFFGDRSGFATFANAREHLYNLSCNATYYFDSIGKTLNTKDTHVFYKTLVEETVSELSYKSERLTIEFYADESCVYQGDGVNLTTACVRGIAKVTFNLKEYSDITSAEGLLLGRLGINQLLKTGTKYVDVDVHMSTQPRYKVSVHTLVPLCDPY